MKIFWTTLFVAFVCIGMERQPIFTTDSPESKTHPSMRTLASYHSELRELSNRTEYCILRLAVFTNHLQPLSAHCFFWHQYQLEQFLSEYPQTGSLNVVELIMKHRQYAQILYNYLFYPDEEKKEPQELFFSIQTAIDTALQKRSTELKCHRERLKILECKSH